mmetsp:Transcript_53022/g.64984  ORF Transcript_53022/g.64984 Transcript_53022/m.64984 type:complete len:192 (-) Transcript_53022:168-743(-)|eukprot:CAMPEP_0114660964 /NCGR_PEP_ID=MMETSP0191-20121206/21364_1 /TAXON_ID=126664 /ORGANISM="Sorites sp." /LENGTH=191 /DNA_ID=CAMNT_0001891693 /DNA_START=60 /DNA_END=635 /DNA_ORIENTATION=+
MMLTRHFKRTSSALIKTLQYNHSKLYFADEAREMSSEGMQVKELPKLGDGDVVDEFFKFNLACPHKELYQDSPVRMVGIPGSQGRFAVTPGHVPVVCELLTGVLSLYHDKQETRIDHYFVSGGVAIVHPDATLDISTPECVLLSDIDPKLVSDGLKNARDALARAKDEKEKSEAEIEIETYEALERALSGQ